MPNMAVVGLLAMAALDPEQTAVLARIADYVRAYEARLPDFVCTQLTRRSTGGSRTDADWKVRETTEEELTYRDKRESRVLKRINGRRARPHQQPHTFHSSGEFADSLRVLFAPESKAAFTWISGSAGDCVFGVRVEKPNSKTTVKWSGRSAVVGYSGTLHADCATGEVRSYETRADDPEGVAVSNITTMVEYGPVSIGGRSYLLPIRAHVTLRAMLDWHRRAMEFGDYHKYSAETSITFEEQK